MAMVKAMEMRMLTTPPDSSRDTKDYREPLNSVTRNGTDNRGLSGETRGQRAPTTMRAPLSRRARDCREARR
jgi:hypothetical protein